ncbi:MAG: hypothetical protein AB7O67_22375 [Vicinamibacterales bacterium]
MPTMLSATSTDHRHTWGVSRCACGHFTLRLGTVRVDLSTEEFVRLSHLLREADAHFLGGREDPAAGPDHDCAAVTH